MLASLPDARANASLDCLGCFGYGLLACINAQVSQANAGDAFPVALSKNGVDVVDWVLELVDSASSHTHLGVKHVANDVSTGGQLGNLPDALLQKFGKSQTQSLLSSQHRALLLLGKGSHLVFEFVDSRSRIGAAGSLELLKPEDFVLHCLVCSPIL